MQFDLALFEQLNEAHREHPVVRTARPKSPIPGSAPVAGAKDEATVRAEQRQRAATMQLAPIQRDMDLAGKVVLEFGCRQGWLTSILPEHAGAARATGVDINHYPTWSALSDPRIELIQADFTKEQVAESGSVDRIIANVSLGRDTGPLSVLPILFDLLGDGGQIWLRIKAFTSPTASGRFKDIFFPWPQLLFEDDVCARFYEKHYGRANQMFTWINRLTLAHYIQAAAETGFDVTLVRRKVIPINVPFYLQFLDRLGRYPALDLETDLVTLVLAKPPHELRLIAPGAVENGYLERQQELDRQVLELVSGGEPVPVLRSPNASSSGAPPDPGSVASIAENAQISTTLGQNINTPDYWDRVYRREWESGQVFSATYAREYGLVHDRIISLIPPSSRVLDVACGSGVLCRKVKERLPETKVTGVDFSQYTVDRAQWVDRDAGIEYVCVDVQTSLRMLDERFDVIVMAEIIEHLNDAPRTIDDAMTLLAPGGRLIITCPHDASIPSNEHVHQWGHDELFHLLTAYSDTVCFTQFPPSHDKWMMAHLVSPS